MVRDETDPNDPGGAGDTVRAAAAEVFRSAHGRVLATLIRHAGGDFELAEDALQDALLEALEAWGRTGLPANPGGWLSTVARRRLLDRLRGRVRTSMLVKTLEEDAREETTMVAEAHEFPHEDDRLRLLFRK